MSHSLRKFKRVSIHRGIMGELNTKLEQYSVKPFFYFSDILNLSLFSRDPSEHYTGCSFIKPFNHLDRVIFSKVIQVYCRNASSHNVIAIFVGDYSLKYGTLNE